MAGVITLLVDASHAGQRLDYLLATEIGQLSRAGWQKQIKAGRVRVDERPAKASHRVAAGERITASLASAVDQASLLIKADVAIKVLYEDNDVVVIDKPAGVVVHPSSTGAHPSVVAEFVDALDDEDELRPGVVHRLDKDTSGVMLLAKNSHAKSYLIEQFKTRKIKKTYLALIWGHLKDKQATIDLPIGRDNVKRTTMKVASGGRPAISHYQVVNEYDKVSLVRVDLETGRTHQIRVHFAYLHHPVVGDSKYSTTKPSLPGLMRQFLHAVEISLILPSGQSKTFTSPLPTDLEEVLQKL